jgi:hypothetical protein
MLKFNSALSASIILALKLQLMSMATYYIGDLVAKGGYGHRVRMCGIKTFKPGDLKQKWLDKDNNRVGIEPYGFF